MSLFTKYYDFTDCGSPTGHSLGFVMRRAAQMRYEAEERRRRSKVRRVVRWVKDVLQKASCKSRDASSDASMVEVRG